MRSQNAWNSSSAWVKDFIAHHRPCRDCYAILYAWVCAKGFANAKDIGGLAGGVGVDLGEVFALVACFYLL